VKTSYRVKDGHEVWGWESSEVRLLQEILDAQRVRLNRSIDTDVSSAGFARLLAAAHLQR